MSAPRPNIVLITTDQQRGDCLAYDGHPVLQTPNLDALAAAGTFFRRGTSECPSCFPARRSLMTGTAPAAQGMVGMKGPSDWNPPHTLAGCLRDAGYQTELVGKLHLQPRGKRFGFEHQELADGPYERDNAYLRWLRERFGRREVDGALGHGVDVNGWVGRPGQLPEEQTMTWWCVEKAIDFLEHRRDPTAPFFLNVSIYDPHPPLVPPPWYYDRYAGRALPGPAVGAWAHDPGQGPGFDPAAARIHLPERDQHCLEAAYYGTCNFIDDQLGRLFQYMRRNGLWQDTLFVFTSDHGEMLGDHHLFRKCWPYEGSTRVPFIVKAPSSWGAPPRTATSCPAGMQDVMPTLLDAAGAAIPEACTGKSLLPIVRGEADAVREAIHAEDCGTYHAEDAYHMLLTERFKYIWFDQRGEEQLFDLVEDPRERYDLAREADAEDRLRPWRERLAETIADRPEGFVRNGALVSGAPRPSMVPGVEPDRFLPHA